MNIGLLGGSFDPIHVGHCILASYIRSFAEGIDEVWMNVSPHNPLKKADTEASDSHRLQMVRLAVAGHCGLKVCDIEYSLQRPYYTIDTLRRLSIVYPDHRFRLVIGSDNWRCFDKWKNGDEIIADYGVIVYPRPGYPLPEKPAQKNVVFINAPQIDISSTFIRNHLKAGVPMDFFLPEAVCSYITDNHLYQPL